MAVPKKAMAILTESMFYVLMALMEGEKCGTDVADYIDARTGGRLQVGPATLYTILAKFESEKYIKEVLTAGRKRTYAITERGAAAYDDELARLRSCVADAEAAAAERSERK